MLSPGEAVMRPEWARAVGEDNINRMNRLARTGNLRNKDDIPLRWPWTSLLQFALGGVAPHVAAAGAEVERVLGRMPGGMLGLGSRPNVSDHPRGLAIDFMVGNGNPLGDRVASYLQTNSQRLAIKYLIWKQRINSGSGWTPMENRGSITANHFDHVHASFTGGGIGAFLQGLLFDAATMIGDLFNKVMNPIKQQIGLTFPPGQSWVHAMPLAALNMFGPGVTDFLVGKANELFGAVGMGAPGSGPVVDQVRQAATPYGWNVGAQWDALSRLIQKESSWIPTNQNPISTAYGLFQFLDRTWGAYGFTKTSNPLQQAVAGMSYIKRRHGDPMGALRFHLANNWYDRGGQLPPGLSLAFNGTNKPERVLTDDQWRTLAGAAQGGDFRIKSGQLEIVGDGLARIVDARLERVGTSVSNGRRM